MLTDLQPHQQATAIVTRLQGQNKDLMLNRVTPAQLAAGGPHPTTGEYLDPASLILAILGARLSPYPDEETYKAMQEVH